MTHCHSPIRPAGNGIAVPIFRSLVRPTLTALISFSAIACLAQDETKKQTQLTKTDLPGTRNVHVADNVFLAGQPSEEALSQLAEKGVKTVITLRHKDEERWDEQAVCERLGMEFIRCTISSPDDLDAKLIDQIRERLKLCSAESGVLLHCASANRVGAVWLAHRVKDGDLSVPEALAEAKRVGMASKELHQKALEYLGEQ